MIFMRELRISQSLIPGFCLDGCRKVEDLLETGQVEDSEGQ